MGLVKFGSGNGKTAATDFDCLSLNEIGLGMIVRGTCLRVGAEPEGPTWFNVKAYLQSASTSMSMAPGPLQLLRDRTEVGSRAHRYVCGNSNCVYTVFSLCKFSIHTRRKWTNHQRQNSLLVALENEDATRRKRQHKTTLVFSLKDLETTLHGWTRYPRRHILLLRKGSKVLRVMTLAEGTQKTSR